MTFEEWMQRVDSIMVEHLGLGYLDIADQNYRDMFDDGFTPLEAVQEAVENEFGYDALDTFGLGDFG